MKRMRRRRAIIFGIILCVCSSAYAEEIVLNKPVGGEAYIKGADGKAKAVRGMLVRFDNTSFTMLSNKIETQYDWADCTPASAVTLRQKTINRTSATDWLTLGEFAWNMGAASQAKQALRMAVQLDDSLQSQADGILASTPQLPARPVAKESATGDENKTPQPDPGNSEELIRSGRTPADPRAIVLKPARIAYAPATPEQADAANAAARERAAETARQLGITFHEMETDHFLIFTDWDQGNYDFLQTKLEKAYTIVARQFGMDAKDNIFVGKLPVFMFERYEDFSNINRQVAGYYQGTTNGFGHMAMWKPDKTMTVTSSLDEARQLWGHVLIHEFTHAFMARYRSNVHIPTWLNEGIAELISSEEIPQRGQWTNARQIAMGNDYIGFLFRVNASPPGRYYPVMHTIAEMLAVNNRKNLIKMIDAIKDGTDPEEALQTYFKLDFARLEIAWREYARRLTKN
jgi:hypothetical protein